MKKSILPLAALTLCLSASGAFAADVSININGFVPPPPGVHVYVEGGRPCYRENGRVVYLERQEGRRGRGHAYGHYKGEHGKRGHRGHGEHRDHEEHGGHGHGKGH